MEFLLSRYRNLTVLLLVILAQLVLLAYQVKGNQDVRLIRVWAVTAVTPVARVLEFVREHTIGVVENYFVLVNVRSDNGKLLAEVGRLRIENQFLKTELQTADRARALAAFQHRTPSRTLPARIIGTGTGSSARVVFIDRGSGDGILRGMAVITPDGIVGKVLASYPTASQVLLITDPTFAAGVISDKNHVHGTVKGTGQSKVKVDYVQNEEKVEVGEIFYTSGDDRIFPKGMPVGRVTVVRPGQDFKEIYVVPSGSQQGLEEVLVVIEGVNTNLPDPLVTKADPEVYIMPQPAPKAATPAAAGQAATGAPQPADVLSTDADRIRERYKKLGEQQGVVFGERGRIPDFNAAPPKPPTAAAGAAGATGTALAPAVTKPPTAAQPNGETPPVARPKPPAPKPAAPPTADGAGTATGQTGETSRPKPVRPPEPAPVP